MTISVIYHSFICRIFLVCFIPVSVILFATTFAQLGISRFRIELEHKRMELLNRKVDKILMKEIRLSNCRSFHALESQDSDVDDYQSSSYIQIDRFEYVFNYLIQLELINAEDVKPILDVSIFNISFFVIFIHFIYIYLLFSIFLYRYLFIILLLLSKYTYILRCDLCSGFVN